MDFLNGKKAVFSMGDVGGSLSPIGHLTKCDISMSRNESGFTSTDDDGMRYAPGLAEANVTGSFNYVVDAGMQAMGQTLYTCGSKAFSVAIKDCAETLATTFTWNGFVKQWNISNITNDGSSIITVDFDIRVDGVITETVND